MKQSRRQLTVNIAIMSTLGVLLGTAAAWAHPAGEHGPQGPGRGAQFFERWDKDHDGRISIAELPQRWQAVVSGIDTNRDGTLTREEFEKGKQQLWAAREKQMDKNGDGKVTDDERREVMRAHVVERFIEQDRNHDGFVVEAEVPKPVWEHLRPADANSDSKVSLDELKAAFDEGKLQLPTRGAGLAGSMKERAQERFNSEDQNKDGFLVETEVPKQKWEHIKAADTNHDNRISFDELTAAFKAGKIAHRGPHHEHRPPNAQR
jgi:Ca2+-binding EF-hand superfamily protein